MTMTPSSRPSRPGRGVRRPPRLLEAPLFRSILVRERKRAERSGRPVALALVSSPPLARRAWPGWPAVLEQLATLLDATTVVGWHEPGMALGILCPGGTPDGARPANGGLPVGGRLRPWLEQAVAGGCSVRVLVHPAPLSATGEPSPVMDLAWYPELACPAPAERCRDAAKRGVDLAGSLLALVLLAPLLAAIAALVKLTSPGPALFGQTRIGHRATSFTLLKFRTMHVHADAAMHREFVSQFIAASGRNGGRSPASGFFKLTDDPRITPIGRVLRKTSLDELPQLWNVLRGEMSLVGPRPPVPYEYVQYRPWHRRRVIETKPGMTGLWQVTGRSRTTFDEMVRLDLRYARTRALWRDLAIIARTPAAVISGKGAC
jgi:lipopolysaccharide/colanic/teichoic acid biosynthesis glycosyltransferase